MSSWLMAFSGSCGPFRSSSSGRAGAPLGVEGEQPAHLGAEAPQADERLERRAYAARHVPRRARAAHGTGTRASRRATNASAPTPSARAW